MAKAVDDTPDSVDVIIFPKCREWLFPVEFLSDDRWNYIKTLRATLAMTIGYNFPSIFTEPQGHKVTINQFHNLLPSDCILNTCDISSCKFRATYHTQRSDIFNSVYAFLKCFHDLVDLMIVMTYPDFLTDFEETRCINTLQELTEVIKERVQPAILDENCKYFYNFGLSIYVDSFDLKDYFDKFWTWFESDQLIQEIRLLLNYVSEAKYSKEKVARKNKKRKISSPEKMSKKMSPNSKVDL